MSDGGDSLKVLRKVLISNKVPPCVIRKNSLENLVKI